MHHNMHASGSDSHRQMAHTLLVELLAHQFCAPVSWIKTQAALLDQSEAQRLVEIGPAPVLMPMLKKTLAEKHTVQDNLCGIERELLDFEQYLEQFDAVFDDGEEGTPVGEAQTLSGPGEPSDSRQQQPPPPPTITTTTTTTTHTTSGGSSSLPDIPDRPVTALEVIIALTAHALRSSVRNLDADQSIKSLAKGRSTVQNELIGNLQEEFGRLPDDAESLSLKDVAAFVQRSFAGKLGRQTGAWLKARLASKLPPSFSEQRVRSTLKDSLGLSVGPQDSVLLSIDYATINGRIASDDDAMTLLRRHAQEYLQKLGISTDVVSQAAGPVPRAPKSSSSLEIDSTAAALLASKLTSGARDKPHNAVSEDKLLADGLQRELDRLYEEVGADLLDEVSPKFKRSAVYTYDSSRTWGLQDLYLCISMFLTGSAPAKTADLDELESVKRRIINRQSLKMIKSLRFLQQELASASPQGTQFVTDILSRIDRDSRNFTPRVNLVGRQTVPRTTIDGAGEIIFQEIPVQATPATSSASDLDDFTIRSPSTSSVYSEDHYIDTSFGIQSQDSGSWHRDADLTRLFTTQYTRGIRDGLSLAHSTVLVTGAGPRSIGSAIVRHLVEGGARVVVTTSRLTRETRAFFQDLYSTYGSVGSQLVLVPFNQGSREDVANVVEYIHAADGLGWELDHIIPFAAIPDNGSSIENLDSKSELAHRIMLTNVLRLVGAVAASKRQRRVLNHPAQVLLPLSPNHGLFGNDGLYSESKLALEALLNKWESESWSEFLSVCGVSIGWTRGTGLMNSNDIVAERIERLGARTFSVDEMAGAIVTLMTEDLVNVNYTMSMRCDFSGGVGRVDNLRRELNAIRKDLTTESEVQKALRAAAEENATESPSKTRQRVKRANIRAGLPKLPAYFEMVSENVQRLDGLLDLERTVVVAGFAEVCPQGSSRTRWELEAQGKLSLEGCVELAWIMGLIKPEKKRRSRRHSISAGWVEADTGAPIADSEVKAKFEQRILDHTGIRIAEPRGSENEDPRRRNVFHQVELEEDLAPFECPVDVAESFKAAHGEHVEMHLLQDQGNASVQFKQGARIMVPKAVNFEHFVTGQVPQGWDAARYGIPPEIISQVNPATLFVLVAVAEAFLQAGVTDAYEFYKYMHVSDVGNCIGSGLGGIQALKAVFQDRVLSGDVHVDSMSETFISTAAAWVNLLLLSASGPIKNPVGACATALESLDTGFDLISSGRTKMCLVGGFDSTVQEVWYEFGALRATVNVAQDLEAGREPGEMSRPATTTRRGFVQTEGCGVQILTNAQVALEMGLPVYGVVAAVHMAADQLGRSIPAPGPGVLSMARERPTEYSRTLLTNLDLRRRRIQISHRHIEQKAAMELEQLELDAQQVEFASEADLAGFVQERRTEIERNAAKEKQAVVYQYGHGLGKDNPHISPMAGALATFGLTVDDVTFTSFHGTSTQKNELNECKVFDAQMRQLGRSEGHPVYSVFQKSLTGHGLGAAAAFMINGGLQALNSGVIPGNRNGDNIDQRLDRYESILFASKTFRLPPAAMKAFSASSFGFGQKGAQAIIVHPRYLYAALSEAEYDAYRHKVGRREQLATRELQRSMYEQSLFRAKERLPYANHDQMATLLDPLARLDVPEDQLPRRPQ